MATNRVTNRQKNPGSTDGHLASSSGSEVVIKSNFTATTAPSGGNDTTQGYVQGSLWYDITAKRVYLCENNATGAAIWKSLGTVAVGQLSTTGTAGTDTFLRGDGSWNNALTGALSIGTKLTFTSTTTVTAANREIVPTSVGLGMNTPSGTSLFGSVNDVQAFKLGAASSSSYYGYLAGNGNTGGGNTFIGYAAAETVTNLEDSVVIGYAAGASYTSTAFGRDIIIGNTACQYAEDSVQSGSRTVVGYGAGMYCDGRTTIYGYGAGSVLGNGTVANTLIGDQALSSDTSAQECTVVGFVAAASAIGNAYNSVFGSRSMYSTTTGTAYCCAFGYATLQHNQANHISGFGFQALANNSTGVQNCAFGSNAGTYNDTGSFAAFFGYGAGFNNTSGTQNSYFGDEVGYIGSTCGYNSGFGTTALYYNTGSYNSAFGSSAMLYNSTGQENCAFGETALAANTTGSYNSAFGRGAGATNSVGAYNTFFGHLAGSYSIGSIGSTLIGAASGLTLSTGLLCTAVGKDSMRSNSSGNYNACLGDSALFSYTSGNATVMGTSACYTQTAGNPTAFGFSALFNASTANYCGAFGYNSLHGVTTGGHNNGFGYEAFLNLDIGNYNTGMGSSIGATLTEGSYNTLLGAGVDVPSATGDYQVNIANLLTRDTSGHFTLNYGSSSYQPAYIMTGEITKQDVYGVTYADSSTTAIITLADSSGRVEFFDDQGEGAVVRYDSTSAYLEQYSSEWSWTDTPSAGNIGLEIDTGVLYMYLGSSATRKIGWFIRNVNF